MAVGGQRHAPAILPSGMNRCPLYRRLGGPQGRSGRVRKISTPTGFDPRTVQPVASHYTYWAIQCTYWVWKHWSLPAQCERSCTKKAGFWVLLSTRDSEQNPNTNGSIFLLSANLTIAAKHPKRKQSKPPHTAKQQYGKHKTTGKKWQRLTAADISTSYVAAK
jgi:hypothetical protein